MDRYQDFEENRLNFFQKVLLILFILFYPFLVSMYPMLPPFIGLVGYIIIYNLDKNPIYALSGFFYLLNLELNSSLPLFLSAFMIMMIYIFLYSSLKLLIRCRVCLLFALMILIDFSYYVGLFLYDFVFNTSSVVGDILLVYYIVIDILIGVFL